MVEVERIPALVPARMINETLFCERLLYLEWAQGEFAHNYFTADGSAVHRRVDRPGGTLPDPASGDDRAYVARSVWLSSEALGITAKIDLVESEGGAVTPVEYKRGEPPDVAEGAYLPERAQLCAQVLLLREHGYRVDRAEIYFAAAKRRVPILIDDELIATTKAAATHARRVCASREAPPPLTDSPKCAGCSLVAICLPDETNLLRRGSTEATEIRRLHPLRDDKVSLHVQEQGARIGLRDECLVVRSRSGVLTDARLIHTSNVCLYGNVQMSTQALRALLYNDVPVSFFTTGGWYCGRAIGTDSKNVDVRIAQFSVFADPDQVLHLACGVVSSKIKNCRTLLRRNCEGIGKEVLGALDQAAERAADALALETLLGIEGAAARTYFGAFGLMLKAPSDGDDLDFSFEGRNRRPPRDPVNALLSLAYALLVKDLSVALSAAGLDPLYGFYHQPRFGRPSLALDLMEEFRPLVADSVVISVINTGEISGGDFVRAAGSVALTPAARRSFIQAYERRMDQLVTHPVFGYRISYRRVLEVQARLLTRVLLGEIVDYPQFRTR